jgi:hypothetical protein
MGGRGGEGGEWLRRAWRTMGWMVPLEPRRMLCNEDLRGSSLIERGVIPAESPPPRPAPPPPLPTGGAMVPLRPWSA